MDFSYSRFPKRIHAFKMDFPYSGFFNRTHALDVGLKVIRSKSDNILTLVTSSSLYKLLNLNHNFTPYNSGVLTSSPLLSTRLHDLFGPNISVSTWY